MIYVYGTDSCVFCTWAVNDCKRHKKEYTFKNITYKKFYNEMIERGGDPREMPQIWFDNEYIGTYESFVERIIDNQL